MSDVPGGTSGTESLFRGPEKRRRHTRDCDRKARFRVWKRDLVGVKVVAAVSRQGCAVPGRRFDRDPADTVEGIPD